MNVLTKTGMDLVTPLFTVDSSSLEKIYDSKNCGQKDSLYRLQHHWLNDKVLGTISACPHRYLQPFLMDNSMVLKDPGISKIGSRTFRKPA